MDEIEIALNIMNGIGHTCGFGEVPLLEEKIWRVINDW